MKAYTLLVLFSVFQVLFCAIEGLNATKLHDFYVKKLPYLKTLQNASYVIPKSVRYNKVSLKLNPLDKNNTKFIIDDLNVIHVKFTGLNAKLSGQFKYNRALKNSSFNKFNATLTNLTLEQQFLVNVTKAKNGKKTFRFKKSGQTPLTFKVQKVEFVDFKDAKTKPLAVKAAAGSIKNLNFKNVAHQLGKLQLLILNEFAKEAQK